MRPDAALGGSAFPALGSTRRNGHQWHLYVVDGDISAREQMIGYLRQQDLTITALDSAQELLQRVRHQSPDLVILDVGPPRQDSPDGLETCRRLRAEGNGVPVILLGTHSDEIDRVLGLEMGADDYLGKPVGLRELLARVRAVLRRVQARPGTPLAPVEDEGVRIGEYVYQATSRCLLRGAELRILNAVEQALLSELTAHPNVPITRERLREVSHADPSTVLLRAVDAAVMRLRKAVEPDPAIPRYIQTVRGLGYVFVPQGG